jgi:hypothetical protein
VVRVEMNFLQGCLLSIRRYRYMCIHLPVIDRAVPYLIRSAILHSPPTRISSCFPPIHVDLSCDLQILHNAVQSYIINP